MAAYRLEMWFNYNTGTYGWGAAQASDASANPPFSNGGTAIAKNPDGSITISGAGNASTMDIYLFDVSGDTTARDLQWIMVDYEKGIGAGGSSGRDPIEDAIGLRDGVPGAEFMGPLGASGTTTGVGQENTVFSAPAGTNAAQRRWSASSGFQGVTPGHYQFTAGFVVTPANGGKSWVIDPEMDINM